MAESDCFNGTLPDSPLFINHGKEIYYTDIMRDLSDQFMWKLVIMSFVLFVYVLYNLYIISPVMLKEFTPGTIKYWVYDLSQIAALVFSLSLFVLALIGFYNWRI